MEKNPTNRQTLYEIDSCRNILCLDDEEIPVTVRAGGSYSLGG